MWIGDITIPLFAFQRNTLASHNGGAFAHFSLVFPDNAPGL